MGIDEIIIIKKLVWASINRSLGPERHLSYEFKIFLAHVQHVTSCYVHYSTNQEIRKNVAFTDSTVYIISYNHSQQNHAFLVSTVYIISCQYPQ